MSVTASIVLTTISDPIILEDYYDNFSKYEHLGQVQVFVIPDKKTPSSIFERAATLSSRGLKVTCSSLDEQESYLRRVGYPTHLIPYNSDNRRNVGYLLALESGADFMISIDDDNYCLPNEDFFAGHQVVCDDSVTGMIVNSSTGWYNVCDLLVLDQPVATYARGFPYQFRHRSEKIQSVQGQARVRVNAGLWLKDPDVDAISWLVNPVHSQNFKGESVILGDHAWSPVNSQNTALHRDAIVCYYFVRMGYPLAGIPIDRYGDIFSGYFLEACVRHMEHAVRFGTPIADHRRNSHDYMNDAANEWACIMVLEDLLPWLTNEASLKGDTYAETYLSLSYALEEGVEKMSGRIWTDATRGYFHQMAYCMRQWVETCRVVSGG